MKKAQPDNKASKIAKNIANLHDNNINDKFLVSDNCSTVDTIYAMKVLSHVLLNSFQKSP